MKIKHYMKKYIIGISIIIVSYLSFAMLNPINSSPTKVSINCTDAALARNLLDLKAWQKWWPGNKINDTVFSFGEVSYTLMRLIGNGATFKVSAESKNETGFLQFASVNDTSCNLVWTPSTVISPSLSEKLLNPFQKSVLKDNIALLLDCLKNYFNNPKNIYGFKVNFTKVTDPHLISSRKAYNKYPSTDEIYGTIEKLQAYAISNGAEKTNYPMMNVHQSENGNTLDVMIALPVNNSLKASGEFLPKFMIQGVLLEAEVKGGAYNVEKCLGQFSNYLTDYKLSAPAIPYQSLVTDRSKVLDSNLWITKIYQPVFRR
jgi:hypothetical protein